MWLKTVFVVLIASDIFAIDHGHLKNSTADGFEIFEFWTREHGDNLVYTCTKVTIPSQENQIHEVVYSWNDPLQRVTHVTLQCNANCSGVVIGGRFSSELAIYATAMESGQMIATVFIYALTVGPGVLDPDLQ